MQPDQSATIPATNGSGFPPALGDQPAPPRVMGQFASFALAMSTICILAGGITSFPVGFCGVGGASIGIGWPIWILFSLAVALTMGQVASAFPRAGGPCEWAAELGGAGWGWGAGCFNLAGLITVLAAVNLGLASFTFASLARFFPVPPELKSDWGLAAAAIIAAATQAHINQRGIRLTVLLTDFSGYLILAVSAALALLLLVGAAIGPSGIEIQRLWTFDNFSGKAGGEVWPAIENTAWLFALGLLLPAYTVTGFDASAQTAEETHEPDVNVPKAIWQAVLISGIAGWFLLAALVLAAPDVKEAAAAGDDAFFHIVRETTPHWTHAAIYLGAGIAQYLCGLAIVTAASRLAWAMARDGGLPLARSLRRIGKHKTPAAAIWAVTLLTALLCISFKYVTISAVSAALFYVAYVIPTACGLYMHGRWPRMGPWHLGRWYPPLAIVCILGCLLLFVLAVQPPNEINLWFVPAMTVALLVLWFGYFRYSFRDDLRPKGEQTP